MARATFFDDGGLIWIDLGDQWPGFTEAMNDGISTLSPRGTPPDLSAYWLDHAASGLAGTVGDHVTSGNSTRIVLSTDGVIAHSDYELFDDEEMPRKEFADLLRQWHEAAEAARASRETARPHQAAYQRNPPT